ncbi:MAG: nuclear transport factor 2 family protein [Pyrinomonadaceae bacterium]
MKSILAIATLMAMLSLCNLSEKLKPEAQPSPSKSTTASTDRNEVLAELLKIEKIITDASINGDIATLAPYIADDYSGAGIDGRSQNKNQLLASTKYEKNLRSWTITEAQLVSLDDESAVVNYLQSVTARNGRTARARVIDTFVRRDGRWQVKSEQQTLIR